MYFIYYQGGEVLDWMIWACFICIMLYSSYPGKIRKLEHKIKKLERIQKGNCKMSNIINSLIGKECKIRTDDGFLMGINGESKFSILEADDEWIKLSYLDKKHVTKIKVIRIDSISNIELISE